MITLKERQLLIAVTAFAISMALLESCVVIYLRALMYPMGFSFPLTTLNQSLNIVEISREAGTIIMLVTLGWIAGHNRNTRFGWFLYAFGLWDLFYYVFLKIFLNWPLSFATWDVLFLLPMMWVGPVWSPVLLAFTMILFALILLKINRKGVIPLGLNIWIMVVGTVTCIVSFCWDPMQYLRQLPRSNWHEVGALFDARYVPNEFPLFIYMAGLFLILFGIVRYLVQNYYSTNRLMRSQMQ